MSDNDETANGRTWSFSRRKLLGAVGTAGAASALGGAATNALLWDEEIFGNATDPNVLRAGKLDLKVDWEVYYYDWLDSTPQLHSTSDDFEEEDEDDEPDEVDQPGPIVDLQDVKPGDVIEHTLSLHVHGNPAFVDMRGDVFVDDDSGITEPEDKVNGHTPDESDGTEDGDLDDHMRCLVWHDGDDDGDSAETGESDDPGNNFPDELLPADTDYSKGGRDFLMDLTMGEIDFDTAADAFVFEGTLREFLDLLGSDGGLRLNPGDDVASVFPETACFRPSTTHYLGVLCWVPYDLPGVNNNIIQTDRLEYAFGFHAEQCRHNTMEETGECPDCSFDTSSELSPEVNVLSVDPSSYPSVTTRLQVDTSAGNEGDLTASDFAICEDSCGQALDSLAFEAGGKLDLVVVFDDTGSMGGEITDMKKEVNDFTDDLEAAGVDARYALVSFKDNVELDTDFTNASDFQSAVNGLFASGGGDAAEDNVDALGVATRNDVADVASPDGATELSAYRPGAQRVIIDITDVGAHDETDPRTKFSQSDIEGFIDDGDFSYFAVAPDSLRHGEPVSKRDIAENVDDGTWIDIDSADFDVILDELTAELTEEAYVLTYTTTNPATDGSTRTVDIEVTDPSGTLYGERSYTAPSS